MKKARIIYLIIGLVTAFLVCREEIKHHSNINASNIELKGDFKWAYQGDGSNENSFQLSEALAFQR